MSTAHQMNVLALKRRPMVALACVVVLGCFCGLNLTQGFLSFCLISLTTILTLCASVVWRKSAAGIVCIFLTFFGLGLLHASIWAEAHEDPALQGFVDHKVELIGTIASDPQRYSDPGAPTEQWRFELRTERVRRCGEPWTETHGDLDVLWFTRAGGKRPFYGQRVSVFNTRIRGPRHVRRFRSLPRISTGAIDVVLLEKGAGNALRAWCYEARSRAARHLSLGIESYTREFGLMHALLLGYRASLDRDIRDMAAASGTVHVFAISGLHVGIVVGLIVFALNACRVSRIHWIVFLAPCLIGYTMMTGARPSAVRACIMALVYFAAAGMGRKADVPSAVALAAMGIVIWAPGQLYDLGFLFSFTVVIGLIVFCPLVFGWLSPLTGRDRLKAPILEGAGDQHWRGVRQYMLGLFTVSIAAWLASAPMTAYYFQRATPIALVGNLVVIPVTFLLVLSGAISVVTGGVLPLVAEIFNHASLVLAKLLVIMLTGMSCIPLGHFDIASCPVWAVWLCYCVLVLGAVVLYATKASRPQEPDTLSVSSDMG